MPRQLALLPLLLWTNLAAELGAPIDLQSRFNQGRPVVSATLNGAGPFWFLLDTACTIPTIHPALVEELSLEPRGFVRIHGIAGVERAPTYPNLAFALNSAEYRPRRVAAIPSERNESRRRRDGVIGSSFFERFVVEIDAPRKSVRLHSATHFVFDGPGEILPLRFQAEIPVLKGSIVYPDRAPIETEFEIDTGCDSGICLGNHFVEAHKLLSKGHGKADEKFGVGGSVRTHNGSVPMLRLGKLELKEAQTDFFLEGSPVDEPLAGHIGMGLLQHHRVFFDYARHRVIVVP